MRLNTPVTASEYPFPAGETLVSTTDLKGRITYCNPAFITVSGYAREELLGQPHNMIRHPDMPEEAFRDMWATIASGQPWSAPVKNRRKDGSCYWVIANVTPLMSGDQPTGYMSVRTAPDRADVERA
ncbi:MAG: PAS domain-containing protein, partial [Methylibium sp.]